jgi:hypothetical protein
MSTLVVRASVHSDVEAIANDVRSQDRDELWRGWRMTPEKALAIGLEQSTHVYTAFTDRPLAMFGVVPISMISSDGSVWLIGTNAILENRRAFLSASKPEAHMLMQRYRSLSNWVDSHNRLALRWLQWLGFQIEPASPFGPDRWPFHRFELAHV